MALKPTSRKMRPSAYAKFRSGDNFLNADELSKLEYDLLSQMAHCTWCGWIGGTGLTTYGVDITSAGTYNLKCYCPNCKSLIER